MSSLRLTCCLDSYSTSWLIEIPSMSLEVCSLLLAEEVIAVKLLVIFLCYYQHSGLSVFRAAHCVFIAIYDS